MPPDFKPWLDLAHWAMSILLAIGLWLRKPGEDAGAAVATLKTDHDAAIARHATLLALLEERVKHMPTSEELAELEGTVKAMAAQMQGVSEGMGTMRGQLNRIENYLLDAKR